MIMSSREERFARPCPTGSTRHRKHMWAYRQDGSSYCVRCGESTDEFWAETLEEPRATAQWSKSDLRFLKSLRISPE